MHYLNGKFVTEEELVVPVRDLGFMRGYAVFDFLITYQGGKPFFLRRHVERLFNSARTIGLETPWSMEEVEARVMETLTKNADGGEKAIKIVVSGGVSSSLLPEPGASRLIIIVDPLHTFPEEVYTKGVSMTTDKHTRYAPSAKTNNYIEGVHQVQLAQESGSLEPIYYDDTQVFEGASSNVWAVIDGALLTPKTNILEGVTREVLLKILRLDIPVRAEDFTIEKLRGASEIFIAASNKEIMPVVKLDDRTVGAGTPGPITREVMKQFRTFTESDQW